MTEYTIKVPTFLVYIMFFFILIDIILTVGKIYYLSRLRKKIKEESDKGTIKSIIY